MNANELNLKISIKSEPVGEATRLTGLVGDEEVISVGNTIDGVWKVLGSSCLPINGLKAAAYILCMNAVMRRAREYGADDFLGNAQAH